MRGAPLGIEQQLDHRLGERLRVPPRHQQTGDAVLDRLRRPADRGRHHRPADAHGLQQHAAQRLGPHRGHHDHVGGAVEREQLGLRQHAQRAKIRPRRDRQVALPREREADARHRGRDAVERLQQHRRPLPDRELARVEHQRARRPRRADPARPVPPPPTAPPPAAADSAPRGRASPAAGSGTRRGCPGSRRSGGPPASSPAAAAGCRPTRRPRRCESARGPAHRRPPRSASGDRAGTCRGTA